MVLCLLYREKKKCQRYLIYDKANGDVARLEWVGDSLYDDDANLTRVGDYASPENGNSLDLFENKLADGS